MIERFILFFILINLSSCSDLESQSNNEQLYLENMDTIVIGNQTWTTKNLNVDHFRNGDKIPEAKTNKEWVDAGLKEQPAWCHYDNDMKNGQVYGKLYNWYAISDKRGLSPVGFHIPDIHEWDTLFNYLGNGWIAGDRIRDSSNTKLKKTNITNNSGFSALAAGFRYDPDIFYALGYSASWWTVTEVDEANALFCDLDFNMMHTVSNSKCPKIYGLSVRCIKDH